MTIETMEQSCFRHNIVPVNISMDLHRTEIHELGRRPPYYEYPMANRPLIVARIVLFEDETRSILMGKSIKTGLWELPGGKIEFGDRSIVEGGIRELYEETGLVAKGKGYAEDYYFGPGVIRPGNYLDMFFSFHCWSGGLPKITEDGKHSEWFFWQTRNLPLPNHMMPSSAHYCTEILGKPLTGRKCVIDLGL